MREIKTTKTKITSVAGWACTKLKRPLYLGLFNYSVLATTIVRIENILKYITSSQDPKILTLCLELCFIG
jgi:hypothetical protein